MLGTTRILRKIVDCNDETGRTSICWVGYEKEKVNETKHLRQRKKEIVGMLQPDSLHDIYWYDI